MYWVGDEFKLVAKTSLYGETSELTPLAVIPLNICRDPDLILHFFTPNPSYTHFPSRAYYFEAPASVRTQSSIPNALNYDSRVYKMFRLLDFASRAARQTGTRRAASAAAGRRLTSWMGFEAPNSSAYRPPKVSRGPKHPDNSSKKASYDFPLPTLQVRIPGEPATWGVVEEDDDATEAQPTEGQSGHVEASIDTDKVSVISIKDQ